MADEKKSQKRILKGTVVSTAMDKTAVVRVDRVKLEPKYKKRIERSKKYKIDDPKNECQVGDLVAFEECRPMSKGKRWRFINKINLK